MLQNKNIHVLEEMVANLQSRPCPAPQARPDERGLEKHCQALQKQVDDMEVCAFKIQSQFQLPISILDGTGEGWGQLYSIYKIGYVSNCVCGHNKQGLWGQFGCGDVQCVHLGDVGVYTWMWTWSPHQLYA